MDPNSKDNLGTARMRWKETVGFIVAGLALLFLLGSCMAWRWNECRGVGHGVAYCVMDLGR